MLSSYFQLDVIVAVALIGLMLAGLGLWARRRTTPVRCRKCDFDLTGLLDSQGRESVCKCPECGNKVTTERDVVRTAPLRRWHLIVVGGMLLCLSFIAIEPRIQLLSKVNWYRFASDACVIRNAGASGRPGAFVNEPNKALAELRRRLDDGVLSTAMLQTAITTALSKQPKTVPGLMFGAWGDFVEHAREKGLVSNADWLTYAKAACQPACVHERGLRTPDGTICLFLENFGPAATELSGCSLYAVAAHVSTTVNGATAKPKLSNGTRTLSLSGTVGTEVSLMLDLPSGTHTVVITWSLKVFDRSQPAGSTPLFTTTWKTTSEVKVD